MDIINYSKLAENVAKFHIERLLTKLVRTFILLVRSPKVLSDIV